jgi:hypothetical protein
VADVRTFSNMAGATGGNGVGPSAAQSTGTSTPDEDKLWNWLDNLATESERVRREEARFDDYSEFIDLYYGKHWPTSLPSFRPPVVANELRTLILSEASDLTETQLRVYIAKDPQHWQRDETIERAFRAVWAREQVDIKLMYACVWALIVGTGFVEVGWDPDGYHGLGDVTVRDIDPRFVLPDPDALDDRTWLYTMKEHVLDIHEIRRLFPVSGLRVRPEDRWSVKDNKSAPTGLSAPTYIGPLTPSDSFMHGTIPGYKKARARVLDCYLQDARTEEKVEEEKNHDGTPLLDESGQPKLRATVSAMYPKGRRIIGANGTILYDGPNPNPGGDFGMLRLVLEPPIGRFWGTGFVQQTSELQLAIDKLLSNNVENSTRLNNGVVVSTTNTGLDWETFAGIPAQIVQINPGSEFKIQYPPPMPPDMVQAPFRYLDLQRRLLGFEGARSGSPSKGNVSAELTETEISQSQSPTRLRSRMLHAFVQRLAEMIFARMAAGYTTPRTIPTVEGEAFKPVQWEPLPDPEKYAVYVDPASFTIMSKTMLRRMSVLLYKLRGIDRKALLEFIGIPDAAAISKRLDEAEKLAALAKIKQNKRSKG